MQNAFGFTDTQMGLLMSVFGTTSMLAYFPGGWLADKFSPRRLMTIGLLVCGSLGFYIATLPSFTICLIIYGTWGVCICLVFWSAMIKATREWAPAEEQGRAFGILESGRGTGDVIIGFAVLTLFGWMGSNDFAYTTMINILAASNIALAAMVWFTLEKRTPEQKKQHSEDTKTVTLADIIEVLKIPEVWLIAIVILASYCTYWGGFYFAKFSTDAFALSIVIGALIGTIKTGFNPFAPLIAGFLADRVGISKSVFYLLVMLVVTFFILGAIPYSPGLLILMLVTMALTAFGIYALRGIYFALMEEGGIPLRLTGTAAGIISVIGFLPDIFMPYIGGVFVDSYPGVEGFRYYFFTVSGICMVGAAAAYMILKNTRKRALASAE